MITGADNQAAQAKRTAPRFTSTETRQDFAQAARFLLLLDETADTFTFQTFDDDKARRESRRKNGQHDPLARILHGSLEHCWRGLCRLNDQGAGVYVTVNETNGTGRTAAHIIRARAVFEEQDTPNKPPADYPLEPHIEVESSPGKFHRYWLADGLTLGEYTSIQAGIAERYQGDPSAADGINRVMRLPGFYHQKKPDSPHLVTITHESGGKPYSAEQIRVAFPAAAGSDNNTGNREKPKNGFEHSPVLNELARRSHFIGANPGGGWDILCPVA